MKRWPALQGGLLFHRLSPMDNHCNLKNGVVSCPLLMFHRLSPMDNHCNLLPYAIAWPWFVVPSLNPDGQPLQHRESIRLRLGFSRSIAQSRWTTTATRARQAARVLVKEFHRSIPMDNHCNIVRKSGKAVEFSVPSLNPDGQPLQLVALDVQNFERTMFHRSIPMDNHCNWSEAHAQKLRLIVPSLNPDGQPLQQFRREREFTHEQSSIAQSRWTTTATDRHGNSQ